MNARERYKQMVREILEVIKKYEDLKNTEYGFTYEYLRNTLESTLKSLEKE